MAWGVIDTVLLEAGHRPANRRAEDFNCVTACYKKMTPIGGAYLRVG